MIDQKFLFEQGRTEAMVDGNVDQREPLEEEEKSIRGRESWQGRLLLKQS